MKQLNWLEVNYNINSCLAKRQKSSQFAGSIKCLASFVQNFQLFWEVQIKWKGIRRLHNISKFILVSTSIILNAINYVRELMSFSCPFCLNSLLTSCLDIKWLSRLIPFHLTTCTYTRCTSKHSCVGLNSFHYHLQNVKNLNCSYLYFVIWTNR